METTVANAKPTEKVRVGKGELPFHIPWPLGIIGAGPPEVNKGPAFGMAVREYLA
jgi:hypothetical protein